MPGVAGRLVSLARYHLLSHLQAASRLEWRSYTRFSAVPTGAVAGTETDLVFIARRLQDGLMQTAHLEMEDSRQGSGGI